MVCCEGSRHAADDTARLPHLYNLEPTSSLYTGSPPPHKAEPDVKSNLKHVRVLGKVGLPICTYMHLDLNRVYRLLPNPKYVLRLLNCDSTHIFVCLKCMYTVQFLRLQ